MRKSALSLRASVASEAKTEQANESLMGMLQSCRPEHVVAGYLPIGSELDPTPTMAELTKAGVTVCVPEVIRKGFRLKFRKWLPGTSLIKNAFGTSIPESGEYCLPDFLIVPVVAFDSTCARLGYGGGFYDRTLRYLRGKNTKTYQPPIAFGFAYAEQEFNRLPFDGHDQRMDMMITDSELHFPPA